MPSRHHTIDYLEIPVADLAEAKRVYGEAFGWEFTAYGPGYAGIKDPDAPGDRECGGFALAPDAPPRSGGPLAVLYSDDLDATLAAATAAGMTVVKPIFEFPGGRRFHFADPSGNELAVWGLV